MKRATGQEEAEDPAGVGVFCLAPRKVKISFGHKGVSITETAWTGEPVPVETTGDFIQGTTLRFSDEPWTLEEVEKQAAFSGLQVTVDDKPCSQESFVSEQATLFPELGCRIEVTIARFPVEGCRRKFAETGPFQRCLVNVLQYNSCHVHSWSFPKTPSSHTE